MFSTTEQRRSRSRCGRVFPDATSLVQSVSVNKVTNVMDDMLSRSKSFNRNLPEWKMGKVTDLSLMFRQASVFNAGLWRGCPEERHLSRRSWLHVAVNLYRVPCRRVLLLEQVTTTEHVITLDLSNVLTCESMWICHTHPLPQVHLRVVVIDYITCVNNYYVHSLWPTTMLFTLFSNYN